MGLLDELGKEVLGDTGILGSVGGVPRKRKLLEVGVGLLERIGGIDGLLKKFNQKGMGDLVASWVGTGKNLPISAEQILAVLGKKNVAEAAKEAGTDATAAATGLAEVLPGLVDRLTPKGESVEGDALKQGISALLSGKMGDLNKLFG